MLLLARGQLYLGAAAGTIRVDAGVHTSGALRTSDLSLRQGLRRRGPSASSAALTRVATEMSAAGRES